MNPVLELPDRLREKAAAVLQDAGADQAAVAYRRAADLAEEAIQGMLTEALDLEEAELESGYSRSHLVRLLKEERIPDVGAPGKPRILRAHLPRKPGYRVGPVASVRPDPAASRAQVARAVTEGE